MLEATGLTKYYGQTLAVDDVSFTVRPGQVTALLGQAGSGRTTTLRLALGLTRGQGVALFHGRPYRRLRCPAREVGVLLDSAAAHPGRAVRAHLLIIAAAGGLPAARADEVLDLVGLAGSARTRFRRLSAGMARRLALAAALLGDPHTLVLDEPATGLDDASATWLRALLRAYAAEGRAVLLSSATLAEVNGLADHVVVLREGRVVASESAARLAREAARVVVLARTPQADRLCAALAEAGALIARDDATAVTVTGLSRQEVGEIAFTNGVLLHELADRPSRLDLPFLGVTALPAGSADSGRRGDPADPAAALVSGPANLPVRPSGTSS